MHLWMISIGLGIDKDPVAAEETRAADSNESSSFEGDKDAFLTE